MVKHFHRIVEHLPDSKGVYILTGGLITPTEKYSTLGKNENHSQKSKMAIFQAKIGIFELNLALFVGFCQNMHPSAKKLCSEACKLSEHI